LCSEPAAQRLGGNVVDERTLTVDLDHRQPFAIPQLELGIPGNIHFPELELAVLPRSVQHRASPLAEMATGRGVENDRTD
jgi:hypothetical protein